MRRTLIPFLLFACSSLFALEIFPPAPDSHTFVRVRFLANNCVPIAHVAIAGSTITLTTTQRPDFFCLSEVAPVPAFADVGVLAPGVYSIQTERQEHAALIVRDAEAGIVVTPVGVSAAGGRTVQIFSDRLFGLPVTVSFDGAPVTVESVKTVRSGQFAVVTAPPHAPGTIDVTLTDGLGTRKAVAAFTYFDPAAPPDPAIFEPVVFPVAYVGPGLFGSQWRTENGLATGDTLVRFRELQEVDACNGTCGQFNWSALLSRRSQSGLLIWVVRRRFPLETQFEDEFRVSSRIFESSSLDDAGVALPVAREGDFRSSFVIDRVPLGNDARVALRLYSPGDAPQAAFVTVNRGGNVTEHALNMLPVNGLAFATVDLGSGGGARTEKATVSVTSSTGKIWGLVTVTDNATQQVTAFWP